MGDVGSILAWLAPNAVWIGVVIYLITHPEVAAKWGAILNSLFSRISRKAEMRSVALDIQGRIDSFSKSISSEVSGIMPYGVKIEWVTGEVTKESFFKDRKIILKMNYHTNQDENVVHAAMEYIARGMLSDSRPHVDERVTKSADLICTKKLIEKERRTALQLYYGEILSPARKSDGELDKYVLIMQQTFTSSFEGYMQSKLSRLTIEPQIPHVSSPSVINSDKPRLLSNSSRSCSCTALIVCFLISNLSMSFSLPFSPLYLTYLCCLKL